ncbi:hypothetical protein DPMN_161343 [Dreissena polymorpha]|uniref:Secreted protein n=1 Tax=Dreissena polymorpha TaxID=45954 RepID=A0A9D4EPH2_DREPO|nr:hypothetical protein DPMN_161343 [Dreissena polymorpha]
MAAKFCCCSWCLVMLLLMITAKCCCSLCLVMMLLMVTYTLLLQLEPGGDAADDDRQILLLQLMPDDDMQLTSWID